MINRIYQMLFKGQTAPYAIASVRVRQPTPEREPRHGAVGPGQRALRASSSDTPLRVKVRTPNFASIPTVVPMVKGCDFANVPLIQAAIDLCYSCKITKPGYKRSPRLQKSR